MARSGDLSLTCWIHPSMQLPVQIDTKSHPFTVPHDLPVSELMEKVEEWAEDIFKEKGSPAQMAIQVLWNTKDQKKALNPRETIGQHFATGDTFGIYGDIQPLADEKKIPECDKLPVTILTGFLGSGKTTLLNYILQEQQEKKIAVIENEFGEVPIDDELLKGNKLALAEKVIVMDNGCMCCTVRGDLLDGLKQIRDMVRNGSKLDMVMIETTGMADPVPIVRTFMTSEEISGEMRLDGVVTLADAKHIIGRLDDQVEEGKVNEAYQQVAFCDKIILNKLDLVTADEAILVKDRLRSVNAFAKIIPAVKSRINLAELINMRAHDMANFVNVDIDKEAADDEAGHEGHGGGHDAGHDEHGGGHGHDEHCTEGHGGADGGHGDGHGASHGAAHAGGHGHGPPDKKSRHDSRINSFSIVREGEIIPQRLSQWMQQIGQLPAERGTIFRIKAILAVKDHPYKHVFHAVMDVSDEDDAEPWEPHEKKVSKIVFIGKALDQAFLRAGFEKIFEQ